MRVTRLRFEHSENCAIGIGESKPRISWSFDGREHNWTQHSYEIEITRQTGIQNFGVESSDSVLVPWPDTPLASQERAGVRIRVLGNGDSTFSAWSDVQVVEAGLLGTSDWNRSKLIQSDLPVGVESTTRPVIFRKTIHLTGNTTIARLYATAHGIYNVQINGQSVEDQVLAPGWTSYKHRLIYQTYDIRNLLVDGENHIDIEVADGWYCGRLGFMGGKSNIWGDALALIALLRFGQIDGQWLEYGTDDSWKWCHGPTTSAGIYDGDTYDQRLLIGENTQWHNVQSKPIQDNLIAPVGPPIRRIQKLKPVKVFQSKSNKTVIDMGQNMVGWLRIRVNGASGTTITLQHAEVMENGEVGTRPLRDAISRDTLILAGTGPVTWEPKFTFHGFRYVEVGGWPGELDPSDITGIVVHSDMQKTGSFSCSNPLLNKLHDNVTWSMRGNFLSVPTDCPQRDERMGWTGDIAAFSETANFLYDTTGMLQSWLQDLSAEQIKDWGGTVPVVIPNVLPDVFNDNHAIWGDAAIIVPWTIYMASGDSRVLANQYESMSAWLAKIPRKPSRLWDYESEWKLGDWLDPAAPPEDSGAATTDPDLVSDAFLYHVTNLMVATASVLGKNEDANKYQEDANTIRAAFAQEYISPSGRIASDTQTGITLAIQMGLFSSAEQDAHAAERLSIIIRRISRFKIATGFAGTPFVGHALTKAGMSNIFYRMLLHRKNPSWLYPVTMGATTIWERWDSMLEDGTINPGWMTSFNHYALGAVAGWMHNVIAGLKPIEPGWKKFSVSPIPGGALQWAEGAHISEYGECAVRWEVSPDETTNGHQIFRMQVRVPPNSTAKIQLPGQTDTKIVGSGDHSWTISYQPEVWPPRALYPPFMKSDDELPVDEVVENESTRFSDL